MGLIITLLRLIHIFSAVAWIGGGIFVVSVIAPTAQAAGPDGGKFMQWMARLGRLGRLFAAASGLTFLSGLILYPLMAYLRMDAMTSPAGITLTIGAVFGILTFLHGAFITGRLASQSSALATAMASAGGPPKPEQLQEAQRLGAQQQTAAQHSVILGSLALLFMSAAQTVGQILG
jgi:uncharacterized membrane protein